MRRRPVTIAAVVTAIAVSVLAAVAAGQDDPRSALAEDVRSVDVAEAGAAVDAELAEPQYQLDRPWYESLQQFLLRMWVRLVEFAGRVADYVGGPVVLGLLIGGAVIGLAVAITANLGRRRARLVDERVRREHEAARGLDPVELDRRADAAAASGDHETAFRLAFRAGLARLDRRGRIDLRPGTTSGTLADELDSDEFSRLVTRFDAVVYGGAAASADDLERTRAVFSQLVDSVTV